MDTHYPWMNMDAKDAIDHPKHYTTGKIEVADAIAGLNLNFLEGNIVKYVCRYKYKHGSPEKQLEDLKKAKWYLEYLIKEAEKNGNNK